MTAVVDRIRDRRRRPVAVLAGACAVAVVSLMWSAARAVPTHELALPALVSPSAAAAMRGAR